MVRASLRSVITALTLVCLSCAGHPASHGTRYANGLWFDGRQFRAVDFYTIDGLLSRTAPAHVDSSIDLQGGYVVPPFAEAHNHNVESSRFDRSTGCTWSRGSST